MIVALVGLSSELDSVRTRFYQDPMFLTMKQLVNHGCDWLHLMLLDRFLLHLPLNHLLLIPIIMFVVYELEDGVDIDMIFIVTIAIFMVTLKSIVVQRQENNNENHRSLSFLNWISLKTLLFLPLITMISYNLK